MDLNVEILEKNIPYQEITEVLHKAYAEHRQNNLEYSAVTQSWEDTKRRIGNGGCAIVKDGNQIVGTITYHFCEADVNNKWYLDERYVQLSQFAILPEYRTSLAFFVLLKGLKDEIEKKSVNEIILDTSIKADYLVNAYTITGCQIVDFVSWENTNYYSYVFCYHLDKSVIPEKKRKKMLRRSEIKCKILRNEDGSRTFCGKIWERFKK